MRKFYFLVVLLGSLLVQGVLAGEPYSTEETDIGTLMDDPQSRAILEKHIPKNISDSQFGMARMFTLTFIQAHDRHGELTDEALDQMDKEFAALEAGKE